MRSPLTPHGWRVVGDGLSIASVLSLIAAFVWLRFGVPLTVACLACAVGSWVLAFRGGANG